METMKLWNGRSVPRIGVGCWAIGGKSLSGDMPTYYGDVDDTQSIAGLRLADELGARVFDTAAYYGGGHSEKLLGQVFGEREDVIIVTKFGTPVDHETRREQAAEMTPETIRASIERSRQNLRRDRLDLVLFHLNDFPPDKADFVFDTLGHLRAEGRIAAFGWSTDFLDRAERFADRDGFVAVENDFNLFDRAETLMAFVERKGLVSISRLPLAMGMLTGKYNGGAAVGSDDIRAQKVGWMKYFKDGKANPDFVRRLEAVRELLATGGRSPAQGALSWILARSPNALPVPGFKTEAQVRDNLGTLEKGPLPASVMAEIDSMLAVEEPA